MIYVSSQEGRVWGPEIGPELIKKRQDHIYEILTRLKFPIFVIWIKIYTRKYKILNLLKVWNLFERFSYSQDIFLKDI